MRNDTSKNAVERLAEIRIEIEAAKLEKLRAEAEAARVAAEPPEFTPYENYPPPSPADRARFIAKIQELFPPIDSLNSDILKALARDNPDLKLDAIQAILRKASDEAVARGRAR